MHYQAFPNGMTLEEGVARAAKWWDDTGRELIARMTENEPDESKEKLMAGSKFENLSTADKHRIVTSWYENKGKYL